MALVTNDAIAPLRRRQGLIQIKGLSEAATLRPALISINLLRSCPYASLLLHRTVSSLVARAPLQPRRHRRRRLGARLAEFSDANPPKSGGVLIAGQNAVPFDPNAAGRRATFRRNTT
jgi:hypothetical protein